MVKGIKFLGATMLALSLAVAVNLGSAHAASAACVDNLYRQGNSGTCVKYIQTLNNAYARISSYHANNLSTDGVFGSLTNKSIRKLQSSFQMTSDGIVGNKTWGLLCTTQAGWIDEYGRSHMYVPSGWPLSTAKAAGCSKYWQGGIVNGVQY